MGTSDAADFAGFWLRQQRIGTRSRLAHSRRAHLFRPFGDAWRGRIHTPQRSGSWISGSRPPASPRNDWRLQKARTQGRIELAVIVGDLLALADITARDCVAVL